jgi:transcriptional regulator NrdR family protein
VKWINVKSHFADGETVNRRRWCQLCRPKAWGYEVVPEKVVYHYDKQHFNARERYREQSEDARRAELVGDRRELKESPYA